MMADENPVSSEQPTGSPLAGEPVFLVIGKLRRPHGVRGEMAMEVITDFPERIAAGMEVYASPDYIKLHIRSLRPHKNLLLIAFEEFSTPEEVGIHRNDYIYVRTADVPSLPDGEYYHHQLIGLRVMDEDGKNFGMVTAILETGATDVLVIEDEHRREILLPMADDFVTGVDLNKGEIIARILPGLLPGE